MREIRIKWPWDSWRALSVDEIAALDTGARIVVDGTHVTVFERQRDAGGRLTFLRVKITERLGAFWTIELRDDQIEDGVIGVRAPR